MIGRIGHGQQAEAELLHPLRPGLGAVGPHHHRVLRQGQGHRRTQAADLGGLIAHLAPGCGVLLSVRPQVALHGLEGQGIRVLVIGHAAIRVLTVLLGKLPHKPGNRAAVV